MKLSLLCLQTSVYLLVIAVVKPHCMYCSAIDKL